MKPELKKSINRLIAYNFLAGVVFWYGIEQFLLETLSGGEFARGVVTAVFYVAIAFTTIPFGVLSDIWGRVNTLRLAVVIQLISLAVLAFSQDLIVYSIGGFLWGLWWSMIDGAKEAFLYDKLADYKQEAMYERYVGRLYAAMLIGSAIANLSSGFLVEQFSLRMPYYLSAIPAAMALMLSLTMAEPDHHKQPGKRVLTQIDDVWRAVRANAVLRGFLAGGIILGVGAVIGEEFGQVPIIEFSQWPPFMGIVWTIVALGMAAARWLSYRFNGDGYALTSLVILILIYVLLPNAWIGLVAYLATVAVAEIALNKNEVNIQAQSARKMRATIGSVSGTASSILIPFLSVAIGTYSSGRLGFVLGGSILAIYVLAWIVLRWAKGLAAKADA